jgi:hypothetical protein
MKRLLTILLSLLGFASAMMAQQHPRMRGENFQTETPMVHDPVMAKEGDTY